MEHKPSSRDRRGRPSRAAGEKAQVLDGTLHIRHHHQEGTLKFKKFGWLAAMLAVAAVMGAVAYSPRSAEAVPAAPAVVNCVAALPANTSTCTLTFSETGAAGVAPNTITITTGGFPFPNANGVFTGTATLTGPYNAACATAVAVAPTTLTINLGTAAACLAAFPPGLTTVTFTFVQTSGNTTGAAAPPANAFVLNYNGAAVAFAPIATIPAFNPLATGPAALLALVGCSAGGAFVAPGAINGTFNGSSTVATAVTCRISLTDATPVAGSNVASGLVAVTVSNLNAIPGATITNVVGTGVPGGAGTILGSTAQIRCGTANAATPADNSCSFVDITITVPALATLVGLTNTVTIGLSAAYTSDIAAANSNSTLGQTNAFNVQLTQAVAAAVGPTSLALACAGFDQLGATVGPANPVRPGPVGPGQVPGFTTGTPLAIGILPGAVNCTVSTLVNGVLAPVWPGVIEVQSISGTILTLSGTLTTTVAIQCGDQNVLFTPGVAINPNNCTGVRFSVLGQGVGNVEVRARYRPIPVGAPAAPIAEVEVSGFVQFQAPTIGVRLALDPDPVAVGATGTATATLTQVYIPNCALTIGGASTCIDPATGLPILSSALLGSALNGIVVFTMQDTSIAAFTDQTQANAGVTLNTGVTNTANQVIKACGAFSGGASSSGTAGTFGYTNPTGALTPYFGGCNTATATYRGLVAGQTNIAATFIPFLPGAQGLLSVPFGFTSSTAFGVQLQSNNFFAPSTSPATVFRTLQVAGAAPATTQTINLVRGCNNVTPTVTESASAYAARVTATNAVIAVWEHQAANNTFRGAPGAAAPASAQAVADLASVTRLQPVFVCVNAAATLTQPVI